jgi:hypothetical protein
VDKVDKQLPTQPWYWKRLKVETERFRLRLPKELADVVPWLASSQEAIPCLATVGTKGGMTLYPLALMNARLRVTAELSAEDLRRAAAGSETLDYVRHAATSWEVTLSFDAGGRRFCLPEDALKLGLVPESGEYAAVFAAGEILEVWTVPDWLAYIRGVSGNIDRLEQAILGELQSRKPED